MTHHRRRGYYAAELSVGDEFEHVPGRTFTLAENTNYCGMTLNTNSGHLNAHEMADSEFGRPLMNALFVFSCVVGLSVSEIVEGTAIANLEFSEISFPAPVFDGDTVYSMTRVLDVRASKSRPNAAVVKFEHIGTNQDGWIVCIGQRTGLMKLSEEGTL